jgi:hypothetical protein
VGVEFEEEDDAASSLALVALFNLLFEPARLNLVILVAPLVRGSRLLLAALLDVAVDAEDAEDGVLLLHRAPLAESAREVGRGGGRSDEVIIGPPLSEDPPNPRSRVRSPELPSRLTGLNCPGVKLPLTPKLARLEELPSLLLRGAPESKTSAVLLLSKYELLASRRCLGVPLSTGMLWLLIKLGGGIGGGVIVLLLELVRLRPALILGAPPSNVRREPVSHAFKSSDAISLTKMAGSDSFSRSIASCRPYTRINVAPP